MRLGKKKQPHYRIVAIESRRSRNSVYLEKIGTYDPALNKNAVSVNVDRLSFWKKQGAQLSQGLKRLLKNLN